MRALVLFSILVLVACSAKTIRQPSPEMPDPKMWELHWFFDQYLTSVDSAGDKIIRTYDSLNLVKVWQNRVNTYIIQNDTVFVGSQTNSEYQVELFKQDYLVISMVKGRSGVAGPDYFPRDSTLFISFETGAIRTANLRSVRFTRSQEFLKALNEVYPPRTDGSPGYYYAIVSIDFINNQLVLVGDNGVNYTYPLKPFEGAYRFGL